MKSLKNGHFEYLRTDTFGVKEVSQYSVIKNTHIFLKKCSYVLFYNWVYQEFVLTHRVKTEDPHLQ